MRRPGTGSTGAGRIGVVYDGSMIVSAPQAAAVPVPQFQPASVATLRAHSMTHGGAPRCKPIARSS